MLNTCTQRDAKSKSKAKNILLDLTCKLQSGREAETAQWGARAQAAIMSTQNVSKSLSDSKVTNPQLHNIELAC